MKVSELIEILLELPLDAEVEVPHFTYWSDEEDFSWPHIEKLEGVGIVVIYHANLEWMVEERQKRINHWLSLKS